MRPFLPIFFALFFALPLLAQDDPNEPKPFIRAAIIAGMNVSQVDGDGIAGYRKFGANGGAAAYINLPKSFMVSFEILYSMRGAKASNYETIRDGRKLKLDLDYIEVPFMINYNDRDKAIFGVGVSWNTLVRSNISPEVLAENVVFKRTNLDFVGGVTFLIKKRYGINLRYSYSIIPVGNAVTTAGGIRTTLDGKLRNNVLGVRFIYLLN
ncbi:hypothetical protein BH09BAC1_BH09BAC1_00240 [soil metagenome]